MSEHFSELVEISRLNDFKKNDRKLIGAFLVWCSISAARGRPPICIPASLRLVSAALAWLRGLASGKPPDKRLEEVRQILKP